MIYSANSVGPFRVPGYFDINATRSFSLVYRPTTWAADTIYYRKSDEDYDIVIPNTFNGFYYAVRNPGVSGATEPTWGTQEWYTTTEASGLTWQAKNYNFLPPTQTIVASTWTTNTTGVSVDPGTFTSSATSTVISTVPAGTTSFTITNSITTSTGEVTDTTLLFVVSTTR